MKKVLTAFLSETVWRLLLAYDPSRHGLRLPAQIRARLRTAPEAQELSRPWLTSRAVLLEETEDDGLMKWLESVERLRDAPKDAIGEAKRAVTDARLALRVSVPSGDVPLGRTGLDVSFRQLFSGRKRCPTSRRPPN